MNTPTQIERAAKQCAMQVFNSLSDEYYVAVAVFTAILTAELSAQPSAEIQPAAAVGAQGERAAWQRLRDAISSLASQNSSDNAAEADQAFIGLEDILASGHHRPRRITI